MFVVVMLFVGGLIIGILSSNEFQKRAGAAYFSDLIDWRPAVLWSRDRIVAIANTNEPEEPVRALLLTADSSTRVEAINGVSVSSILAIRDSRDGELTAIVFWQGKLLNLGIWEKGNESAPVRTFPISVEGIKGARIAWSPSGTWVFCLLNCEVGPCMVSFKSVGGHWDSRSVPYRWSRMNFEDRGVEWNASFQPAVTVDAAGEPAAIYANAGIPSHGTKLYTIGALSSGKFVVPTPVLQGSQGGSNPTITPSVTLASRIYESGLPLPGTVVAPSKYSDLWTPDMGTPLGLNSDGVWGLGALPSFPGALCGVLGMSRGDANVWVFKMPKDPGKPVIGLRQVTTHAHVDGDPLVQEEASSVRVIYVEKTREQYRVHMLVFPRSVFERLLK